jgi:hypothetical protein
MARPDPLSQPRRIARAASAEACSVCGGEDVAIDAVYEHGTWLLSECRRCRHQWTEGPLGGPRGSLARSRSAPEAAVEAA